MDNRAAGRSRSLLVSTLISSYVTAAGTVTAAPEIRKLAALTGINAVGNGPFATVNILFYTQHLGFSIGMVSTALFTATVLAIGGDFLSGKISDAWSPKPVFLSGLVLSALATAVLVVVWNGLSFVIALCLISLGQGLCMSSNTALIRRIARENPALVRASLRSVLTIGISLGALAAGIVLGSGLLGAFQVAILANALTFAVAAVLLTRIPVPASPPGAARRPSPVLPDRRFTVFSLANGMVSIYLHALSFALPLWVIVNHPGTTWVVGVVVAVNSLLAAALQVPASAGITSIESAGRRLVAGAICVAVSYLFFASGWTTSDAVLVLALIALVSLHTLGEVLYTAGTMELLFRLAPEERQGQYGAFYGISNGLLASVAPWVLGLAVATTGGWGWWVLAVVTLLLALVIRAVSLRPDPA